MSYGNDSQYAAKIGAEAQSQLAYRPPSLTQMMTERKARLEAELKAVLLNNGKDEAWIPRSQIVDEEETLLKGVATRVELPVWLLEKSGLV